MGLTPGVTRRVQVPAEDGAWLDIRMLNWLQVDEARQTQLSRLIGRMKSLEGVTLPEPTKVAVDDPLQSYDTLTLLQHGVAGWSYGGIVDVTAFDEPTAKFAALEVLRLAVPSEVEVKISSSPSIGS